jgi:hypothetical protein
VESLPTFGLSSDSPLPPTPYSSTPVASVPAEPTVRSTLPVDTGGPVASSAGVVLPNPARTPGAANPAVTQTNIAVTICVAGWTTTVRPSSSYTDDLKQSQLATGYAYRGDTNTSDYQEDHLIPLELGGSPASPLNLWPQPQGTVGATTKDGLEDRLHTLVCDGGLSLAAAQHAIATNWWQAYQTYDHPQPTTHSPAPTSSDQPPAPPGGATALCNDGTYSYAQHHQGACSSHGGVRIFYH